MKKLFLFSVLVVVFVGFTACGGGGSKDSNDTGITSFSAGGQSWQISGSNITITFCKGTVVTNLTVTIVLSDSKATHNLTAKDFTDPVKFTVTAEDGTKKEYTATATVSTTPCT